MVHELSINGPSMVHSNQWKVWHTSKHSSNITQYYVLYNNEFLITWKFKKWSIDGPLNDHWNQWTINDYLMDHQWTINGPFIKSFNYRKNRNKLKIIFYKFDYVIYYHLLIWHFRENSKNQKTYLIALIFREIYVKRDLQITLKLL